MQNTPALVVLNTLRALQSELSLQRLASRTRERMNAVLATVLAVCLAHYFGLREIWCDVSVAYHRLLGVASGIATLGLVLAVVGVLFSGSQFLRES